MRKLRKIIILIMKLATNGEWCSNFCPFHFYRDVKLICRDILCTLYLKLLKMTSRNLFSIILKLFGLYFFRDIFLSIPQLLSVIYMFKTGESLIAIWTLTQLPGRTCRIFSLKFLNRPIYLFHT